MNGTDAKIAEQCHQLQRDLLANLPREAFELIDTAVNHDIPYSYRHCPPKITIIISTNDDPRDGLDLIQTIRSQCIDTKIILITRYSSESRAIAALRAGINDYFRWPVDHVELIDRVNQLLASTRHQCNVTRRPAQGEEHVIIGVSPIIQKIKDYLPKVAISESTVLITGDTGTGKECVARQLHRFSRRCDKPLIGINCAALPDSLLESELFGYQRGAFTGATCAYEGKLKIADGGTVFFDEIGDLSPSAQAKVLRVFEHKEIMPLHSKTSSTVNIRIIAATNQDLQLLVKQKQFRQDLYYRLNVARIHLPPLCEHKEDIGLLLNHYLHRFAQQCDTSLEGFTEEAFECLLRYEWPGNIRELRNLIESLFIAPKTSKITLSDLPETLRRAINRSTAKALTEREQLLAALSVTNWNKTKVARQLNWSRMKVYRKINKYRIQQSRHNPSLLLRSN